MQIKHQAHTRTHPNGSTYEVPEYYQEWRLPLQWKAYFYLALFVGNRRGENISLTWNDINLETGEINIDKSTAYTQRKIYHKSTKTYQSRTPIIPPVVIAVLKQWKACFGEVRILMDTYTVFAAKATRYKNPINEVGVTQVYGFDEPKALEESGITFVREWDLTPQYLIAQLPRHEQGFFQTMFAGKFAKKIYRLYEYR